MIARGFASSAVLVDADADACALARRNVDENRATARVEHGDALDVARRHRGRAGAVVCNPPYFEPGTARARTNGSSARIGELDRFVRAARELVGQRARAHFVYPTHSLSRLLRCFHASGLEPKRVRFVHANASSPSRVVLVSASATKPGGVVVDPPLVERDGDAYTEEMSRVLGLSARRADDRARSRKPRAR
jgi:tRNA1Val (adenine37-N6)-methyltransferase